MFNIRRSLNPDTHIALISDINCQDGSYLAELLIENGYEVYGISPNSYYTIRYHNIGHIIKNLRIITGDCCDTNFINRTIKTIISKYPYIEYFHIYDFDIQSDVGLSFEIPQETMEKNIKGTHNLLECIRNIEFPFRNKIKIFHASSSEIFGHGENEGILNENSKIAPVTPYGCSKAAAYNLVKFYRDTYDINACIGILFNHESPRQSESFVTKKIINGMKKFMNDINNNIDPPTPVVLGNVSSSRDWGHALDYVYAMWLMMSDYRHNDYVICAQSQYTIVDFISLVASEMDIELKWVDETDGHPMYAIDTKTGHKVIISSKSFHREVEIMSKIGTSFKIQKELNWEATMNIHDIIKEMVKYD